MLLPLIPILNSLPWRLQNRPQFHPRVVNSTVSSSPSSKRRCDLYDLHKELVPYAEAWAWQNAIVEEKKKLNKSDEDFADSLIILQHHPVYTLGAGSSEEFLNFDAKSSPFDLYRTERGGEVTYHGPGQLVLYPILNLRYYKMDLHWYLRALEEVIIRALSFEFGIEASRINGLTGVWVGEQKLAAVGIKVSQWITYHGLALNVTTDTSPFRDIVPCGIRDRQVGTVKGLLKENFGLPEDILAINDNQLLEITYKSLIDAFCEVFQVELQMKNLKNSLVAAPMS
ncbi:octanoyltransferase LIP2p2, chloroplastic-like [Andrographis paniculata]|uniref:octanoyltransferase LIP2p2, chloroplastic-like n=1 Tax=Andrographis paniculata TaxID=175694 RepID=UPI0021E9971C|nr:octanoyltransferase LIP2p2, chloroplastic-like [Andrographis paniculata]